MTNDEFDPNADEFVDEFADPRFVDPLPPSHVGWIAANGEPGGTDPDVSLSTSVLEDAMEKIAASGCVFYRWTRVDATSGVLDGWRIKPRFQGRVGYGAAPTVVVPSPRRIER